MSDREFTLTEIIREREAEIARLRERITRTEVERDAARRAKESADHDYTERSETIEMYDADLRDAEALAEARAVMIAGLLSPEPRPRDDWAESDGCVLWWRFPVEEPPYVGDPREDDFPDRVTHWTRILVPRSP